MERGCRVLLVEGDAEERAIYRHLLERDRQRSYEIVETTSGTAALQLCQQQMPTLILVTHCLPDLDGLEFLRHLQQLSGTPHLPVIVLTQVGNEAIANQWLKAGAQNYLLKGRVSAELFYLTVYSTLDRMELVYQLEQQQRQLEAEVEARTSELTETVGRLQQEIQARRLAQAALDQERSLLRSLIDSIPDFIFYKSHQGTYLGCNQAFADFVDRSVPDIVGSSDFDLFSLEAAQLVRQRDQETMTVGAARRYDEQVIYQDGRSCYVDTLKTPFYNDRQEVLGVIGICRDMTEQIEAKAKLEAANAEMKALFSAMNELIVVCDRWGRLLKVLSVNPKLVDQPLTDLLGKTLDEIFPPDLAAQMQKQIEAALASQQPVRFEYSLPMQGEEVWADASMSAIDQHTVIWAVRDSTQRKQVEQELRSTTSELQALFAAMNDLILVLDRQGRCLEIPAANSKLLYGSPQNRIGRSHSEVFPAEIAEQFSYYIRQCLKSQQTLNVEYKLTIQGEEIWSSASISPLNQDQVIWVARDITERKEIEQALAEEIRIRARAERDLQALNEALRVSEARFQAFMDHSPAVCFIQNQLGKVVYVNRTGEQVVGIPLAKLQRKTHHHFLPKPLAQQVDGYHQQILQSGQTIEFTAAVRDTAGRSRDWLVLQFPIPTEAEQVLIGGIAVDITERKQAEETVRQLNESLYYQTAQLKATNQELKTFSYSVSHDLRAPLRSIHGFSQILLTNYSSSLPALAQEYLSRIQAAAGKMYNLIDDMLVLSRIAQSEMYCRPVDLSQIAQEIIAELHQAHPERQVEVTLAEHLSTTGDFRLLRIALDNLLQNAWKFTSKMALAKIEVGVIYVDQSGYSSLVGAAIPIYYVRDNGAGFDMAYMNKLFMPFQRLHSQEEFEGTGIGLAIVYRVIRRHGGHIWAESQIDRGTTFYFTLKQE